MPIPENVRSLLDRRCTVAVVGASNERHKYGNIITRFLRDHGFVVRPVNPHEREIAGLEGWPTVSAVPDPVDIVDFVVPPAVALEVLAGLDPERHRVLWFQPGSFDARVVEAAERRFATVVAGPCIMVEAR